MLPSPYADRQLGGEVDHAYALSDQIVVSQRVEIIE
jgi:hypothetical protein